MPTGAGQHWQRVGKRRPCPICHKTDWCLVAGPADCPAAVICARVESPKQCAEAGWLHVLRNDGPVWAPWRRSPSQAGLIGDEVGGGGNDLFPRRGFRYEGATSEGRPPNPAGFT